jgi:hypothetical protein
MHPLYTVDPTNPAFNPFTWYNLIGAAGCVFWILAYLFILHRCFRDRTYGLPIIAICLNFAWEILASFVFPNPVPLWHFFDRAWLVIDVLLVYQLIRWGRAEQSNPEVAKYFAFAIIVPFALGIWGLYAFVDSYVDRLGLVGAFGVNLIMSILFVFFYLARRGTGRGLSRGGAVFKMLGTLGTSIECHFVVRMINPELRSLSFLTFLCVSIFLFDCLYIYLVFRKPVAQAGATRSVAIAW